MSDQRSLPWVEPPDLDAVAAAAEKLSDEIGKITFVLRDAAGAFEFAAGTFTTTISDWAILMEPAR
jgi:hypothetical protein